MSDTGSKSSKDSINNYINDEEAIKLMMEAYDLKYDDAAFIWSNFMETVRKAKEIENNLK